MKKIIYIVFFALLVVPCISDAETIDVQLKGVDDGTRTTTQRDYKEAVLFAKREAIERAGIKIKSMTTVKDMVLYSDYIESKAEAVLLLGYNILDMGYSADGTYQVVLVGQVKIVSEGIDSKELRYAKSLMDRGEKTKVEKIITDIIKNSKDDNTVAEAMYCQVLWKFASDERDIFEKLKAYYPDSKYVSRLESVVAEREAEREAELRRIEADIGRITGSDERYFTSNRGMVLDTDTGLVWMAGPKRNVNWHEAVYFVQGLRDTDVSWRMPTIEDLKTMRWKNMEKVFQVLHITYGTFVWSGQTVGQDKAKGYGFGSLGRSAYTYKFDLSDKDTHRITRAVAVRPQRR